MWKKCRSFLLFPKTVSAHFVKRFNHSLPASYSVYISTCHDIYYNLALEDWIYNKVSFEDRGLLMLWRNRPCVVIGRHQNPWAECDVHNEHVPVARRKSGGGAVYHDLGNVNATFFTHRNKYNRKENLELIADVLRDSFGLKATVNDRDDIMYGQYKISGTAAKLGRTVAYHHCTLLLDVDLITLKSVLKPTLPGIESRATESVRSPCLNLATEAPNLTPQSAITEIARGYLHKYQQPQTIFHYVDPTNERAFPGTFDIYHELQTWMWKFAKTPKFTVKRTFNHNDYSYDISLEVNKGCISNVTLKSRSLCVNNAVDLKASSLSKSGAQFQVTSHGFHSNSALQSDQQTISSNLQTEISHVINEVDSNLPLDGDSTNLDQQTCETNEKIRSLEASLQEVLNGVRFWPSDIREVIKDVCRESDEMVWLLECVCDMYDVQDV